MIHILHDVHARVHLDLYPSSVKLLHTERSEVHGWMVCGVAKRFPHRTSLLGRRTADHHGTKTGSHGAKAEFPAESGWQAGQA